LTGRRSRRTVARRESRESNVLHNRGFTEFGTGGVRAENLARIPRALAAEDTSFARLRKVMGELKRLQELEERD
jgi:hypothetical protein